MNSDPDATVGRGRQLLRLRHRPLSGTAAPRAQGRRLGHDRRGRQVVARPFEDPRRHALDRRRSGQTPGLRLGGVDPAGRHAYAAQPLRQAAGFRRQCPGRLRTAQGRPANLRDAEPVRRPTVADAFVERRQGSHRQPEAVRGCGIRDRRQKRETAGQLSCRMCCITLLKGCWSSRPGWSEAVASETPGQASAVKVPEMSEPGRGTAVQPLTGFRSPLGGPPLCVRLFPA